jgi:2-iminobutanoate/2-iminopropanoate deaminase
MPRDVRPVHHPDKRHVEMPYAPALLVRRGSLLFLSGLTAAPVYHSHPHREEEFDLPPRMREQAVLLMENLKTTLAAAGCTLADVVSATRYLTDVAEQDDLNAVWASYLGAHRPTTTTVEVSRLATHANCKIEISVIAVTDDAAGSSTVRRSQRRAERIPKKLEGSKRKPARRKPARRK